jgi:midasin (ATPase involved in ribosome maturation)
MNKQQQQQFIGESQKFNEQINNIKTQFFSALDDFTKYYVYFNKNPEVNEFQNFYTNSKSQLQTMNRELFFTTNNIDSIIEELIKQVSSISIKLEKEEELYKKLKELAENIDNTQDGSQVLIDDSKKRYNEQYYKNIEIFIGIIIGIILLVKIFKKPIPTK